MASISGTLASNNPSAAFTQFPITVIIFLVALHACHNPYKQGIVHEECYTSQKLILLRNTECP